MLFSPDMLALVLAGTKTQTRRQADPHETFQRMTQRSDTKRVETRKFLGLAMHDGYGDVYDEYTDWRLKWETGRVYSVAPGRGKHGVARIRITDIRHERACDISEADARAEGFASREAFFDKLRSLYGKNVDLTAPYWALTFTLA